MTQITFTNEWTSTLAANVGEGQQVLLMVSPGAGQRGTTGLAMSALGASASVQVVEIPPMPDVGDLIALFHAYKEERIDCIVAVGGGSVIDAAKGLLVARNCATQRELEVALRSGHIGPLEHRPTLVAVPTTAGSGAETTPFAAIWDREFLVKRSVSSAQLSPDIALLDHHLLVTLEGDSLLYPALDTVSHAIESLWSRRRTEASYVHAITAMRCSLIGLQDIAITNSSLPWLVLASVHAGLAISESRTAIAHSISYPLSLDYGVPHGLACSFTLPSLLERVAPNFPPSSVEGELMIQLTERLRRMDLPQHLARYCSPDQVLQLAPRMRTEGRADNFAFAFSDVDLQSILTESIV